MPTILVIQRAMSSMVPRSALDLWALMWMLAFLISSNKMRIAWGVSKELERDARRSFLARSSSSNSPAAGFPVTSSRPSVKSFPLASIKRDLTFVKKFCLCVRELFNPTGIRTYVHGGLPAVSLGPHIRRYFHAVAPLPQ